MSWRPVAVERWRASRMTSVVRWELRCTSWRSCRPTIISMSPSEVVPAVVTVPTVCPSRSTVMRSEMAKTSSSLCEM